MQPHSVLVVDDNTPLREALRLLLEEAGYAVDEAPDGAVALAMLRLAERPLVVLVDYMMPRMSGLELLSEVVEDAHLLNAHGFILLTANSHQLPTRLTDLLSAHAIPIVYKPFDLDDLLAAVAQACDDVCLRTGVRGPGREVVLHHGAGSL